MDFFVDNNNSSLDLLPANSTELVSLRQKIPTVSDFYEDIDPWALGAIGCASTLFLIIFYIYLQHIRSLTQNTPKKFLGRTIVMFTVYPIVAIAALVSITIPSSYVICDGICHFSFVLCAYQYFCLIVDYLQGESNFIKNTDNEVFNLRTPPFCCCCVWLKPSSISKEKFLFLRIMVLQMSVIQGMILLVLNVTYIEDPRIYPDLLLYCGPLMGISIIVGVWAFNVIVRMIGPIYPDLKLMGKFLAIQLVLIICKLQPLLVDGIFSLANVTGTYPLTRQIIRNSSVQVVILLETLLVLLWAKQLYKNPSRRS